MLLSAIQIVSAGSPEKHVFNVDKISDGNDGYYVTFNAVDAGITNAYYSHVNHNSQANPGWLSKHPNVWTLISEGDYDCLNPQIVLEQSQQVLHVLWGEIQNPDQTDFYYVSSDDYGLLWSDPQYADTTDEFNWWANFDMTVDEYGILSIWWQNTEQLLVSPDMDADGIPDDLQQVAVDERTTGTTLLSSNRVHVGVCNIVNISDLHTNDSPHNDTLFQNISINDWGYTDEIGYPLIPVIRKYIIIPLEAKINITDYTYNCSVLENITIYPVPRTIERSEIICNETITITSKEFTQDLALYSTNDFYPSRVSILTDTHIRNYRVILLQIAPIQFNPFLKQLYIAKQMIVSLEFGNTGLTAIQEQEIGADGGYFDTIYDSLFLNYKSSKTWGKIETKNVGPGQILRTPYPPIIPPQIINYVIITTSTFYYEDSLDLFAQMRVEKNNIIINIVQLSDFYSGDPSDIEAVRIAIKDYIQYCYEQHLTSFILLVGDVNYIPEAYSNGNPTDNWYVDVKLEDGLPDLAIGRLSVNNPIELYTFVAKIITYETSPSIGEWKSKSIMVVGYDYGMQYRSDQVASLLYNHNIIKLHALEAATYSAFNDNRIAVINEGSRLLYYHDHGSLNWWAWNGFEKNDFTNLDKLPFVVSNACSTNKYTQTCMGEIMTLAENGGAVAFLGSTVDNGFIDSVTLTNYLIQSTPVIGPAILFTKLSMFQKQGVSAKTEIAVYNLLGDPMLTLTSTQYSISYDPISDIEDGGMITVVGHIIDSNNQEVSTFSGTCKLLIRDSQCRVLQQIQLPVTSGSFNYQYQINCNDCYGLGSIYGYAMSIDSLEAHGGISFRIIPQEIKISIDNDPSVTPLTGVPYPLTIKTIKNEGSLTQNYIYKLKESPKYDWPSKCLESSSSGLDSYALGDPCIIHKDTGVYQMWYSGFDHCNWRIFYAESLDGKYWVKYGGNGNPLPVIDISTTIGVGDRNHARSPSVLWDGASNTYKMWYSGYENSWAILYAQSFDGIHWVKYNDGTGSAIVISPTIINEHDISPYSPCVKWDQNRFKIWFCGLYPIPARGQKSYMLYTESIDGISWNAPQILMSPKYHTDSEQEEMIFTHSQLNPEVIIYPNHIYELYYEANYVTPSFLSDDGIHFTYSYADCFQYYSNIGALLDQNGYISLYGIPHSDPKVMLVYMNHMPILTMKSSLMYEDNVETIEVLVDTEDIRGLTEFTVVALPLSYFESYEDDRSSITVNFGKNVDPAFLSANDIKISPRWPYINDEVQIIATIHNYGLSSINSCSVDFYLGNPDNGGLYIGSAISGSIPSFESGEASMPSYVHAIGIQQIYAVIGISNPKEASFDKWNNIINRESYFLQEHDKVINTFADCTTSKIIEFTEVCKQVVTSLKIPNKEVRYAIMDITGIERNFEDVPGSLGITIASSYRPVAISWDSNGVLYFANRDSSTTGSIWKYDGTSYIKIYDLPFTPQGIDFNSNGILYVTEYGSPITGDGKIYASPDFSSPVAIFNGANRLPDMAIRDIAINEWDEFYVTGVVNEGGVLKNIFTYISNWIEVDGYRTYMNNPLSGITDSLSYEGYDDIFLCDRQAMKIYYYRNQAGHFEKMSEIALTYNPWGISMQFNKILWVSPFPITNTETPMYSYEWGYPQFPAVDICSDGSDEWTHIGLFNHKETSLNYANTLNQYISEHQTEVLPDGFIEIPIKFTATTAGILDISEIATIYYDDSTLEPIETGISDQLMDLDWSPDGSVCLFVGNAETSPVENIVLKYDGTEFTEVYHEAATANSFFRRVKWCPDGSYALIGSMGGKAFKYDPVTDAVTEFYADPYNDAYFYDISWQPDMDVVSPGYQGSALLTAYSPMTTDFLLLYDGTTFQKIYTYTYGLLRHGQWKPDGSYAVVTCSDGSAYKFDGTMTEIPSSASAYIYPLWNPNNSDCLMLAHEDIYLYDGVSISYQTTTPGSVSTFGVDWYAAGGFYLLTCDNGQLLKYFPDSNTFLTLDGGVTDKLYATEWRPNDRYALVIGEDGHVFKYTEPTLIQVPTSSSVPMRDLDWSPDGTECLFIGNSETSPVINVVMKYDTATSSFSTIYKGSSSPSSFFMKIKWCPDGDYALIGSMSGRLYKYSEAGGLELMPVPPGYLEAIYWDISWQPDINPATPEYEGLAIITARSPWGDFIMTYDETDFTMLSMGTSGQTYRVSWRHDGSYAIITNSLGEVYGFDGTVLQQFPSEVTEISVPYWLEDDSSCVLLSHDEIYTFDSLQEEAVFITATPGGITGYSLDWCEPMHYFLITCDDGQLLKYFPSTNEFISIDGGVEDKLYTAEWNMNGNFAFVIGEDGHLFKYLV